MPKNYIKSVIKTVPDYPKPGIMFRDVTSLLDDHQAFQTTIDLLAEHYGTMEFDKIAGTEARGFLFGAPLALKLGIGFIPIRKPGKLPREVISQEYELEYGTDVLEMHVDAVQPGEKVLMIDDLLATGGTIEATAKLIRRVGGIADHAGFVISLPALNGETRLKDNNIIPYALCDFEGE